MIIADSLNNNSRRTYISLFSSAGVGCYGFKLNGFECVATNELLKSRLDVQRANSKCKYDTGYICGDITSEEIQNQLFSEIEMWRKKEMVEQIDVVFATPPCQGMSTVNYKKNDHEQIRNSLVVQAIKIIKKIHPKIFVFENVKAFLKSICTDISGEDMLIQDSIIKNLEEEYNIYSKVINFKDYGVPSSRPRTIVIGTSKQIQSLSPLNLFPTRQKERTLREVIGHLSRLEFGTKDTVDPLHFARPFPEHQIEWIADLAEGQSAFDKPVDKQPYKIDKDGNKVILKGAYMGNKYRRLFWDKPGACIATRNDVLSSQDTIHPCDNRVLSIRELMYLMTIPDSFRWTIDDSELCVENSAPYLKKNEMNIRHCIGEAVPTQIMLDISAKIKTMLEYTDFVNEHFSNNKLLSNISKNYYTSLALANLGFLSKQAEIFSKIIAFDTPQKNVSVKVKDPLLFFAYLPQLASYFSHKDEIRVDLITSQSIFSRDLLSSVKSCNNLRINIIPEDGCHYDFEIDEGGFFPKQASYQQEFLLR